MLVDYRKLDTFMHRLNPRISLMFVLGVVIASIIWTDPIVITVATAGLVALGFACKFPWKQIDWFLKMALGASALISTGEEIPVFGYPHLCARAFLPGICQGFYETQAVC